MLKDLRMRTLGQEVNKLSKLADFFYKKALPEDDEEYEDLFAGINDEDLFDSSNKPKSESADLDSFAEKFTEITKEPLYQSVLASLNKAYRVVNLPFIDKKFGTSDAVREIDAVADLVRTYGAAKLDMSLLSAAISRITRGIDAIVRESEDEDNFLGLDLNELNDVISKGRSQMNDQEGAQKLQQLLQPLGEEGEFDTLGEYFEQAVLQPLLNDLEDQEEGGENPTPTMFSKLREFNEAFGAMERKKAQDNESDEDIEETDIAANRAGKTQGENIANETSQLSKFDANELGNKDNPGGYGVLGGDRDSKLRQAREDEVIKQFNKLSARTKDEKLKELISNHISALVVRRDNAGLYEDDRMALNATLLAKFPARLRVSDKELKKLQRSYDTSNKIFFADIDKDIDALSLIKNPRPEDLTRLLELKQSKRKLRLQKDADKELYEEILKERQNIKATRKEWKTNFGDKHLKDLDYNVFQTRFLLRDYLARKNSGELINHYQAEADSYGDELDERKLVDQMYDKTLPAKVQQSAKAKFTLLQEIKRRKILAIPSHVEKDKNELKMVDHLLKILRGNKNRGDDVTNMSEDNLSVNKEYLLKQLDIVNALLNKDRAKKRSIPLDKSQIPDALKECGDRIATFLNKNKFLDLVYDEFKKTNHPYQTALDEWKMLSLAVMQLPGKIKKAKDQVEIYLSMTHHPAIKEKPEELEKYTKLLSEAQIAAGNLAGEKTKINNALKAVRTKVLKEIEVMAEDPNNFCHNYYRVLLKSDSIAKKAIALGKTKEMNDPDSPVFHKVREDIEEVLGFLEDQEKWSPAFTQMKEGFENVVSLLNGGPVTLKGRGKKSKDDDEQDE